MLEIKIEGGGDQGVEVGGRILADAFRHAGTTVRACGVIRCEGRSVAVVATEGPEIHHLLALDPAHLATIQLPAGHGIIVVNSAAQPCWRMPGAARVVSVDAADIARRVGLGPLVAPAVVGAFAGASGLLGLDDLVAAIRHGTLDQTAENVAACTIGYRETTGDPDTVLALSRGHEPPHC